jgi:ribonuclease R
MFNGSDPFYALLRHANYQPLDRRGLLRKLKVGPAEEAAFAAFLAEEETAGRVVALRDGLYALPERLGLVSGKIFIHERGFGFLTPASPDHPDVYIGAEDVGVAMHQDRVLVRLNPPSRSSRRGDPRSGKLSGQVTKVLQRARTQLVGTFSRSEVMFYVQPDDVRIPHDICVAAPKKAIPLGHKVVVRLKPWTSPQMNPEGEIVEVLGSPNDPGVDLLAITRKYELPEEFPNDVLAQAERIPSFVVEDDIDGREDFRNDFVFTIDPDDAKDFDDALSYRQLPKGELEVAIHIADVSHYVLPGSALDREARERGNSVYLVNRVIPMLPEKLSNGLCSLHPNVDRLVKTVVVRLSAKGEVLHVRFTEAIIHSQQRLTYQEAYKLLKKPSGAVGKHLKVLGDMAQVLRRARFANGALNLDFLEVKVRLDANGKPVRLEPVVNDESHQLIEEYMLLANEVVARHLRREMRPAIYRVHDNPDPDRLADFRVQVQNLGFSVGDLTKRGEIQKLLGRIAGHPEEPVVKTNLLRSMKRAVYSEDPVGHFGLSKKNYTHFTSPIRRYADLVVHRCLFGHATRRDVPSGLAEALSVLERRASEAEQESVKLKKLEYFALQAEATKKGNFAALVLEVRTGGLLVELPEFLVSGFVPISEMQGEIYSFNPIRQELIGERSKSRIRVGMKISVHIVRVDLARRQIDFGTSSQKLAAASGQAAPEKRPHREAPPARAPKPKPFRGPRPASEKPASASGKGGGRRRRR